MLHKSYQSQQPIFKNEYLQMYFKYITHLCFYLITYLAEELLLIMKYLYSAVHLFLLK